MSWRGAGLVGLGQVEAIKQPEAPGTTRGGTHGAPQLVEMRLVAGEPLESRSVNACGPTLPGITKALDGCAAMPLLLASSLLSSAPRFPEESTGRRVSPLAKVISLRPSYLECEEGHCSFLVSPVVGCGLVRAADSRRGGV